MKALCNKISRLRFLPTRCLADSLLGGLYQDMAVVHCALGSLTGAFHWTTISLQHNLPSRNQADDALCVVDPDILQRPQRVSVRLSLGLSLPSVFRDLSSASLSFQSCLNLLSQPH